MLGSDVMCASRYWQTVGCGGRQLVIGEGCERERPKYLMRGIRSADAIKVPRPDSRIGRNAVLHRDGETSSAIDYNLKYKVEVSGRSLSRLGDDDVAAIVWDESDIWSI